VARIQYNDYRLPAIEELSELDSNEVVAFYLPEEHGIERVYLYQGGRFICEADKVVGFNESQAKLRY
jgi:hypothetical protein